MASIKVGGVVQSSAWLNSPREPIAMASDIALFLNKVDSAFLVNTISPRWSLRASKT